ncbi:MAG: hypothetical protein Q4G68_00885 [Planctomycetia bacterium]|nr:hypothetical protein [Planctomycetia bacterium]
MSWQGVAGHDTTAAEFARAASRNRVAGSFLFVGDQGLGKRTFAFALAKTMLCLNPPWKHLSAEEITSDDFVPCNECESCRLFSAVAGNWEMTRIGGKSKAGRARRKADKESPDRFLNESHPVVSHPDLHYIYKLSHKTDLPLRYITGRKGSASTSDESGSGEREPIVSEQGLCRDISQRPFLSRGKIAIIDDADFLNEEGANALLKTLEEPPQGCIIILIGTNTARQLPTILSRCHVVRFRPLSLGDASELLQMRGVASSEEDAALLLHLSGGSLAKAIDLSEPVLLEFRSQLYHELSVARPNLTALSQMITDFIEAKGKEPALRRRRLHLVFTMMMDYEEALLRIAGQATPEGAMQVVKEFPQRDLSFFQPYLQGRCPSVERVVRRIDATLDADRQIDRMVNLPYLIDNWLARM